MVTRYFFAILAVLSWCVTPVSAATIQATYAGTITKGSDWSNYLGFGSYANLAGKRISIDVVFNTVLGKRTTSAGAGTDHLTGGSHYFTTNPIVSTTLNIGGVTQMIGGSYWSDTATGNSGTGSQYSQGVEDFIGNPAGPYFDYGVVTSISDAQGVFPLRLDAPFSWAPSASTTSASGYFSFLAFDGRSYTRYAVGDFTIDSLAVKSLSGPSPVPLPAAGGFLASAVAMVGVARRARRRNQTAG